MTLALDVAQGLRGVLPDNCIREAVEADAVDGVPTRFVVEPRDAQELATALAYANEHNLSVIARGGGTKIDWGNPPKAADLVISTGQLDCVIEHAAGDMTATVQAGCTIGAFQETLAKNGQRLAVDPLWPDRATIGGVIATNDSGALRLAFGPLRDSLIGITVVLSDGTIARSGGKVVKNVAGYDLPKLFIGSFGTLGVVIEATFRLYPLAHATRTLCFETPTLEGLGQVLANLSNCSLVTASIQLEYANHERPRVVVRVEGLAEAIERKVNQVIAAAHGAGAVVVEPPADAWDRREAMFDPTDACVCKISLLPTRWAEICKLVADSAAERSASFRLIGQSMGVGLLQIVAAGENHHVAMISAIRSALAAMGGSLVVLKAPLSVKNAVDIWGDIGDALPIMRRIKEQFDPKGILSPGRFVGGI